MWLRCVVALSVLLTVGPSGQNGGAGRRYPTAWSSLPTAGSRTGLTKVAWLPHSALHASVAVTPGLTTAHAHTAESVRLPIIANGANTPDAIPDSLAYRHFIMVTATAATALPQDIARRDAFLNQVGLSENDRSTYLAALSGVREQLASIAQARSQLSPGTSNLRDQFLALKRREDQTLDSAQNRLLTWLSATGVARLNAHIQSVKKCIVVYGM